MKFSIIVPVYNVENYIEELLESVDGQTFRDFELVMIDDGSTDKSPEICDIYCEKHDNAHVFHKGNQGRMRARLDGVSRAQGDYILFLDSDDMLKSNALMDIAKVIEKEHCDIVIYNASTFDGEKEGVFFQHELPEGNVENKQVIYDKLFMTYSMNSLCLKAVKRELFDLSIDYSPYYKCTVAEDLLQSVPLYVKAKNIYYLDSLLYVYRINSGSTHRYNPEYYWNNLLVSQNIRRELENQGIEDFGLKVAFHILVAAYAGTTQMQYASEFKPDELEKIRTDKEFQKSFDLVWKSKYKNCLSRKQRLVLRLLHKGRLSIIKILIKLRGNN